MSSIGPADAKTGEMDCMNDYLIIPNGSGDGALGFGAKDRYCGKALGRCDEGMATACAENVGAVSSKLLTCLLT